MCYVLSCIWIIAAKNNNDDNAIIITYTIDQVSLEKYIITDIYYCEHKNSYSSMTNYCL